MPNFWRVPLPGEQSNPGSRQYIYRFPDSRTVFWSNPESQKYPSRPDLRTKIQSFIIFQIQEALWRNLNNLKPSFSHIKSFTFQREVKENALASEGKYCRPETIINRRKSACVPRPLSVKYKWQRSHLLSQNLFPSERNLPARENIHWNRRILARGKSRVLPTDPLFTLGETGYWKQLLWLACYVSL